MILHHFTYFYNLENVGPANILAVGLKAMPCDTVWKGVLGNIKDCVWLTTDPDLPPSFSSPWEVRITLVVPSSDRRLVHVPKLGRGRLSSEVIAALDDAGRQWRTYHMFFGDIPLNCFRAVEYARREEMLSIEPERLSS